jgi:hypothetical protein
MKNIIGCTPFDDARRLRFNSIFHLFKCRDVSIGHMLMNGDNKVEYLRFIYIVSLFIRGKSLKYERTQQSGLDREFGFRSRLR